MTSRRFRRLASQISDPPGGPYRPVAFGHVCRYPAHNGRPLRWLNLKRYRWEGGVGERDWLGRSLSAGTPSCSISSTTDQALPSSLDRLEGRVAALRIGHDLRLGGRHGAILYRGNGYKMRRERR
jgi:hypothetical protein